MKHLQRVRLSNRERLLIWTPGPVPFETDIFRMLRPVSPELVMFPDFEYRKSFCTYILLCYLNFVVFLNDCSLFIYSVR